MNKHTFELYFRSNRVSVVDIAYLTGWVHGQDGAWREIKVDGDDNPVIVRVYLFFDALDYALDVRFKEICWLRGGTDIQVTEL